jgi:hypothetical protein
MSFLDRYRAGEHTQVWNELQSLGAAVRQEPHLSDARAVAAETMQRVRRNCERIIAKLNKAGYRFDIYPDGSKRHHAPAALVPPSKSTPKDIAELEQEVGAVPLSLVAFWQEVGSVDLVGRYPSGINGLDPLVVDPPEGPLSEVGMWEGEDDNEGNFSGLAPDDLHKDNVSGGDPYGIILPNASADFLFLNERHNLHFVPYLQLAILKWGGFPGLDGSATRFDLLEMLRVDLEPF